MNGQCEYSHTQKGKLYWVLLAAAALTGFLVPVTWPDPLGVTIVIGSTALILLLAAMFTRLTIEDRGEHLLLRYGPVPSFRKRLRYAGMASAREDRNAAITGWGIRWMPGEGWTYNLWGWDCVEVTYKNGKTVRIGTDDPAGLAEFLGRHIAECE